MRYGRFARGELPVDTTELARALIGAVLVREAPEGRCAGRVVEVEAYLPSDPASHSYGGKTARNASMFLGPHRAYVYMIYGTSFCLNVTSESAGVGAAVLIRALEPLEGLALMERRHSAAKPRDLCRGPGRLCRAFAITPEFDGKDVIGGRRLWLARSPSAAPPCVGASVRIGITKAADRPLRFFERGNSFVSGPRGLSADSAY